MHLRSTGNQKYSLQVPISGLRRVNVKSFLIGHLPEAGQSQFATFQTDCTSDLKNLLLAHRGLENVGVEAKGARNG